MRIFQSYSYCFFFFCFSNIFLFAQKNELNANAYSYKELKVLVEKYEKQLDRRKYYIDIYIRKAKKENNLDELCYAYSKAPNYMYGEAQIKYSDSALIIAKKLKDNDRIGDSYLALGMTYCNNEDFPKALDSYLKGYEYIKKGNDQYLLNNAKYQIAVVKNYLGLYQEADGLFKSCVDFFRIHNETKGITNYKYYFIYSLIAYTDNNLFLKKYDENDKLIKEGKSFIIENKDLKEYYPYFLYAEGANYYYKRDYNKAIEKLNKALSLYNDNWKHLTNQYYLGMSYWMINQHEKALYYFLLLDKDFKDTKKLDPFFRPAYECMINYYKKNGNTQKQLEFINKLIVLDKTYEKDYKYLHNTLSRDYDIKRLKEEKSNIENNLKWERYLYLFLIGIGLFLLTFSIYYLIRFNKRKEYYKKLYSEFSLQSSNTKEVSDTKSEGVYLYNQLDISPIIVENVLNFLDNFEKEKQYLKKKITLENISKDCGVNTSYFSKILNHYKQKNLNTYLNDLRLNYIMNRLKATPQMRYYSIQQLADKSGYNSAQSFSKNFKEKYKISPVYFLEQLNNDLNS